MANVLNGQGKAKRLGATHRGELVGPSNLAATAVDAISGGATTAPENGRSRSWTPSLGSGRNISEDEYLAGYQREREEARVREAEVRKEQGVGGTTDAQKRARERRRQAQFERERAAEVA